MGFSIGQLGPDAWTDRNSRSYHIRMPLDAADIWVSCEEADCDKWWFGWETVCDESTAMGAKLAMLFRSKTGLPDATGQVVVRGDFTETREVRDGRTVAIFHFSPGQECFESPHRIRARPAVLLVHQRGQVVRQHTRLRFLAEDYTEHMGGVADQQKKG